MNTYNEVPKTKVNQILIQAQAIISNGWAQNTLARTAGGKAVETDDPRACSFCMLGAMDRARQELKFDRKAFEGAAKRVAKVFDPEVSDYLVEDRVATNNDDKSTKKVHVYDTFTLAILGAP